MSPVRWEYTLRYELFTPFKSGVDHDGTLERSREAIISIPAQIVQHASQLQS